MKKWIVGLLVLLLVGCAAGEVYPGNCPHDVCVFDKLMDEHQEIVLSFAADMTGFTSGICEICYEKFIFYTLDAENVNELVCDGVTHIYQNELGVLEEGWHGDDPVGHTYRVYRAAKCVYCNERVKCYARSEKMNDAGLQQHNWTEYGSLGYHENGTNWHVYVTTCTECGYAAAVKVPCAMFDNDICIEEINKAREFYNKE